MSSKYEKLIDLIINEESDKARALFHQIVVEQSRQIYESIAEDEFNAEVVADDAVDAEVSDDETEDFVDDVEGEDESDVESEGGEADLEDRVLDLESAIDELQAEFDQLMAEEGDEEEHQDDVESDEVESEDEDDIEESMIREYVEKVAAPVNSEGQPVGATGRNASVNKSSVVAGKNDLGGSAKNIAQGGREEDPDGKAAKKPSNEYTKGEGKLIGKVENTPGANTKGYADRRTAK